MNAQLVLLSSCSAALASLCLLASPQLAVGGEGMAEGRRGGWVPASKDDGFCGDAPGQLPCRRREGRESQVLVDLM